MASRFLQVLLSATVVAFIAVGCGNRGFNPPSDEDMIHNFYAHEDAFNEITEILLNCPYGDIYPPFYPIGSATDSLCLSSLGNEKCTRLDSLLASVGGRRLYFKSRHTLWQIEHGDFNADKVIKALAEEHLTFAVSPIHDRDVDEDGSLKKSHYHLLLAYSSATTLNNICGWFNACGMPESDLHSVRVCASGVGYYRYLTHKDNPEKAQYDDNDIRVFNDSDELFKRFSKTSSDKIDDLVRIFQIVDELDTISFHCLLQYLMLNERDLFKMITSSSALAICVKEYQRSLEYDLKKESLL